MSIELLEQNPDLAKKVNELIKEASNVRTEIDIKQGSFKDIKTKAKTDYGIDGKTFGKLFKLYHEQARDQFEEENNDLVRLYDLIENAK